MVQKINLRNLLKIINSVHLPHWLIAILAVALIFRIPSFFEPYSYGDETIYLTLGEGIRQGKALYRDIHDNKPPLLYLLAAVSGSLFWFKAILAFWSLTTIVIFWKLSESLFPQNKKLHKVSTAIFALLTTLPLLEGNIANAENFMIGFTLLFFLILLTQRLNPRNIVTAGALLGVATLFKVPAAFDLPAIVFYWLITNNFKNLRDISKRTLYLIAGFAAPIFLTFVWFALRGALNEYLVSGFLQNFGYLSTFRPADQEKSFLIKNGPLIFRGVLVLAGMSGLYIFRKKLSKQFVFLTAWLLLTLFAVTLSERPYPHYLLQSVAPVSLMFGMLFTLQSLEQSLVILPLALTLLVPVYYKFWYYSTSAYYLRFLNFVSRNYSKEEYLSKFGSYVPTFYKIAEFVSAVTNKKDGVFVWGPESQTIYALTRRFPPLKYVAQYHINDFGNKEDVIKSLRLDPPKIIVALENAPDFPELSKLIKERYLPVETVDNTQIYLRNTLELP